MKTKTFTLLTATIGLFISFTLVVSFIYMILTVRGNYQIINSLSLLIPIAVYILIIVSSTKNNSSLCGVIYCLLTIPCISQFVNGIINYGKFGASGFAIILELVLFLIPIILFPIAVFLEFKKNALSAFGICGCIVRIISAFISLGALAMNLNTYFEHDLFIILVSAVLSGLNVIMLSLSTILLVVQHKEEKREQILNTVGINHLN